MEICFNRLKLTTNILNYVRVDHLNKQSLNYLNIIFYFWLINSIKNMDKQEMFKNFD